MSKDKREVKCGLAERFADEFCYDADICETGADWILALAGRNERARLAAGALLAVASRLRGFHADFRVWRTYPPCAWKRTIELSPAEARKRLEAMNRECRISRLSCGGVPDALFLHMAARFLIRGLLDFRGKVPAVDAIMRNLPSLREAEGEGLAYRRLSRLSRVFFATAGALEALGDGRVAELAGDFRAVAQELLVRSAKRAGQLWRRECRRSRGRKGGRNHAED